MLIKTSFSQLAGIHGMLLLDFSNFLDVQKLAIWSLGIFFVVAFVLCLFQWPRNCAVSVTLVRMFSLILTLTSVWDTNNGSGKVDCSNAKYSNLEAYLFVRTALVLQNHFLWLWMYFYFFVHFNEERSCLVWFVLFIYMFGLPPPGNNDRV